MLNNNRTVVAFDCDGTLIYQVGEKLDTPRHDVVELFHALEALGCTMIIWSGGGVNYAEHWRNKLGLKALVIPKRKMSPSDPFYPDLTFDDQEVQLGKVNIQV